MQTSEIMPTKKLVLVQGLDVAALAVNVLLIYLSLTARHIHRESESSVGFLPQTWASNFHLKTLQNKSHTPRGQGFGKSA